MMGLTSRQADALRYITGYQEATGGVSPTFRQIAVGAGLSPKSKNSASGILDRLELKGLIRRLRNRSQAIEILHPVSIPRDPDGNPLYFVRIGEA